VTRRDLENKIAFQAKEFRKRDEVDGCLNRVVDEPPTKKNIEKPSEVISPERPPRPEGDVRETCGKGRLAVFCDPGSAQIAFVVFACCANSAVGTRAAKDRAKADRSRTSRMMVGTDGAIAIIEGVGRKPDEKRY
jgi:hypothetical protein